MCAGGGVSEVVFQRRCIRGGVSEEEERKEGEGVGLHLKSNNRSLTRWGKRKCKGNSKRRIKGNLTIEVESIEVEAMQIREKWVRGSLSEWMSEWKGHRSEVKGL